MKKILALLLVICLAMAIGVGATLAYFTAEDTAKNEFTVGNVKIDLTEPKWDENGSKEAPEVYPGEALAKDPTVTNTGNVPLVNITLEDDKIPALSANTVAQLLPGETSTTFTETYSLTADDVAAGLERGPRPTVDGAAVFLVGDARRVDDHQVAESGRLEPVPQHDLRHR